MIRRIGARVLLILVGCMSCVAWATTTTQPFVRDWSGWPSGRAVVQHPALGIKAADIERARRNIERHEWARETTSDVVRRAEKYCSKLDRDFLERMIPSTTPLSGLFTPCPECRAQKLPYIPHGNWSWSPANPERLQCAQCKMVFPNDRHLESIVLRSKWDPAQTFSYCGGETFVVFSWKHGRPSFTGNVRARKVSFMAGLMRDCAEAYALTGQIEYALACRQILLRFAEVYPKYLVHCGYGEVADYQPSEAVSGVAALREPELTYPPNKPDRALHTGFWTAGRATGVGMEGTFTRQCAEAYDLTCDAPGPNGEALYSTSERTRIERDLLLESTGFGTADPALNNKSVTNRTAAGLVGACVGEPALARFGLQAFRATVDEWFLPDGATPESPSYGMMAIGGVRDIALAYRDYSDPPGYRDESGGRLEHFSIFRDTAYPRVWQGFINCLQGDLTFPSFADSYPSRKFPVRDAEILAAMLPEQPQFRSLLRELSAGKDEPQDPSIAIYLRDPQTSWGDVLPVTLADNCMPDLRIGFMRSGERGRESLLSLSASHWGVHHHHDSLNLSYWREGREYLTDLGYLWDHPDEQMTERTFAHNLVMIDEEEQQKKPRGGNVEFFRTSDHVKVMCASSKAYAQAGIYRRTSALIDHGQGRTYAADFFEVQGGKLQDFVYHGPGALAPESGVRFEPAGCALYDLASAKVAVGCGVTTATALHFDAGDGHRLTAWNLLQDGETLYLGQGWGQRDPKNSDRGTSIPYVVRRFAGPDARVFMTVFEAGVTTKSFVTGARLRASGRSGRVMEVTTRDGVDLIALGKPDSGGRWEIGSGAEIPSARFAVLSRGAAGGVWNFLVE